MGQLSARSIRTFVLRQGRLTEGQQRSLDHYWGEYGIDVGDGDLVVAKNKQTTELSPAHTTREDHSGDVQGSHLHDSERQSSEVVAPQTGSQVDSQVVEQIDLRRYFDRDAPVWMEIGIGNGDALVSMAENNPQVNFLGVEVHLPGIGHALGEVGERQLSNVRLIRYDVVDLIEHFLMPASLDRVLIFFPDPWHKTRHHKRRLVNANFLNLLRPLLRDDAVIHFASDWVPYAEQVRSVVDVHPQFEHLTDPSAAQTITGLRPQTHFERRGLKLGHEVNDLVFKKIGLLKEDR